MAPCWHSQGGCGTILKEMGMTVSRRSADIWTCGRQKRSIVFASEGVGINVIPNYPHSDAVFSSLLYSTDPDPDPDSGAFNRVEGSGLDPLDVPFAPVCSWSTALSTSQL